jgi:hypothetical protein
MSAERQVMQDYIDALVKRADFTTYFTDLREDRISALRIYFPMSLLIEQLTG